MGPVAQIILLSSTVSLLVWTLVFETGSWWNG